MLWVTTASLPLRAAGFWAGAGRGWVPSWHCLDCGQPCPQVAAAALVAQDTAEASSVLAGATGQVAAAAVAQSCPTPRDPVDCSTTGFPVRHRLPELT